jgi:spore coat protein U-like protein
MKKKSTLITFTLSSFLNLSNSDNLFAGETTADIFASATISSTCTISASTMTFATYSTSEITATSDLTVNCTSGATFTTYITDSPDGGDSLSYKLVKYGTDGSSTANYLLMRLKKNNSSGAAMTSGTATFTGTGTGSGVSVGAIYGIITASQTGRSAGTFSKVYTLNIDY